SEPRATVCSDTVVRAPASAPTEIQPAIFSLWLMGSSTSSRLQYTPEKNSEPRAGHRFPRRWRGGVKNTRKDAGNVLHGAGSVSGLALPGNSSGRLRRRLGIAEVVVAQRFQVGVEFIDQGNPVGDVQADDVRIRDAVEVLHQGADGVPVR